MSLHSKEDPAFEAKHDGAFTPESAYDNTLPTEEELATLPRVSDKIPWKVYTVAFVELCERFSYYGTQVLCKCSPTVSTIFN